MDPTGADMTTVQKKKLRVLQDGPREHDDEGREIPQFYTWDDKAKDWVEGGGTIGELVELFANTGIEPQQTEFEMDVKNPGPNPRVLM